MSTPNAKYRELRSIRCMVALSTLVWGYCGTSPTTQTKDKTTTPPLPAPHASRPAPSSSPRSSIPFLKGSTHVHTMHSGDSHTSPGDVIRWYEDHHYDFIVITDHNRVTSIDYQGRLLVIPGIELTNNPPACSPPPPLPEGKCRIHVNALFTHGSPTLPPQVRPPPVSWRELHSIERIDLYRAALRKTAELGGIAQLNHPTWHWGVTENLVAQLASDGLRLMEIANTAFAQWNRGSPLFPSTEALWDQILSRNIPIYGIASDDAHHYHDIAERRQAEKSVYPPGGGFVMVRAIPRPESIRDALYRGDFYSSTGILLDKVEVTATNITVQVQSPRPNTNYSIAFIGYNGQVLRRYETAQASFPLAETTSSYVRAVLRNTHGEKAWTQPIFLSEQ